MAKKLRNANAMRDKDGLSVKDINRMQPGIMLHDLAPTMASLPRFASTTNQITNVLA